MRQLIPQRRFAGTLLFAFLVVAFSAPTLSQPRIEFAETVWNFGRLLEGEMVTHTYQFRNSGDRPLMISEVETTCGCTAALLSDSVIDPGDGGDLKVTFNSTGRVGDQMKSLYVHSNDPKQKAVELKIQGHVYLFVRASPRSLNFGDVPKGRSKIMTVTLTPWLGTTFEILDVVSPSKYFVARASGRVDSWRRFLRSAKERVERKFGEAWHKSQADIDGPPITGRSTGPDEENSRTISVTLLPNAPVGQHSGRLKIRTDVPERSLMEVSLHAKVVGDLMAVPKHQNLGTIERGKPREAIFSISSTSGRAFRITGLDCNSKYAAVELVEAPSKREQRIKVTISPDAPVGQLHGTVTASTNDPDQPELEMVFYGNVTD